MNDPKGGPERAASRSGLSEGKCQVCGCFRDLEQYWPTTLPARFVDICATCKSLGDMEIARRLPYKFGKGQAI